MSWDVFLFFVFQHSVLNHCDVVIQARNLFFLMLNHCDAIMFLCVSIVLLFVNAHHLLTITRRTPDQTKYGYYGPAILCTNPIGNHVGGEYGYYGPLWYNLSIVTYFLLTGSIRQTKYALISCLQNASYR